MNKFLASLIFQTWASQFDPAADHNTTKARHTILISVMPHNYPPAVPAALRGPKWGKK
ncbi:hypothetical protein [Streptomyces sp. NPDC048157]|uniref:hypothetical protein n=1 Tax=Streptomyces sp. NPDC048157 TaxID=3365503 RepID=UPI00371C3F39